MKKLLIKCDICGHEFDHMNAGCCDCGYDCNGANIKCPNCLFDIPAPEEIKGDILKQKKERSIFVRLEKELGLDN